MLQNSNSRVHWDVDLNPAFGTTKIVTYREYSKGLFLIFDNYCHYYNGSSNVDETIIVVPKCAE